MPERETWGKLDDLDQLILRFVSQLGGLVMKYGGHVVHAAHPAFAPILVARARQFAKPHAAPLTLIASSHSAHLAATLERAADVAQIVQVSAAGNADEFALFNPESTPTALQLETARQANFMVAVGGTLRIGSGSTPEIVQALTLARRLGVPCLLVGTCGEEQTDHTVDLLHLFSGDNGLPADDIRRLAECSDGIDVAVGRLLDHLVTHPGLLVDRPSGTAPTRIQLDVDAPVPLRGPGVYAADLTGSDVQESAAACAAVQVALHAGDLETIAMLLRRKEPSDSVAGRRERLRGTATTSSRSILVVDRDATLLAQLKSLLESDGHLVASARGGEDALRQLRLHEPDLLLMNLEPGEDGVRALRRVKELRSELPVAVMANYLTVEQAVAAVKAGAMDVLQKPIEPLSLRTLVERARAERAALREVRGAMELPPQEGGKPWIVGSDPTFRKALQQVSSIAGSKATVLLIGETGTGKSMLARYLHAAGLRARGPFVSVNCAAIPAPLLEFELFGHTKGAFTGAVVARQGRFEQAERGTIFLKEIGEYPLPLQPRLVDALQDGFVSVRPVGGADSRNVDARVVAASSRDFQEKVAAGGFREDLYHRLSTVVVRIPPLRARKQDIPQLAIRFATALARQYGKQPLSFSDQAIREMQAYEWPGNVRELQNRVERAVILCEGETIEPRHLPPYQRTAPDAWRTTAERAAIDLVLKTVGGDRRLAAERLHITYDVLRSRLRQLGISDS